MEFNKFIWEIYCQSEQGKNALKKYATLSDEIIDPDTRDLDIDIFDEFKDQYEFSTVNVNITDLVKNSFVKFSFSDLPSANNAYIENMVKEQLPFYKPDKTGKMSTVFAFPEYEEDLYDYIAPISLGLYLAQPGYFSFYDFRCKFNQLEEIHTVFNIPLPVVPGKNKKDQRGRYYLEINQVWQEFRNLHGLTPAEFLVFLYDFAPQFITPLDATDLPSPSKVWIITGGEWDFEFIENSSSDTISRWGGNPNIRRGDILMMYCVSPQKYIHSIWRACSDGFIDPFFHYHGTVWICSKINIKPVLFSELKQHPLLSQKPAIRASFQGPSGKASFTVEEYEAIIEMVGNKGFDTSVIPRLPFSNFSFPAEINLERDVEIHLIEPLLKRLGYNETDWVRQMPVKMGRGERNYPDYAISAISKRGEESAKFLLESKFQLSSTKDFTDAFYQAKSYALRLQSKVMALAAIEGVWVFPLIDGNFSIRNYIQKTWGELNHPDEYHKVLQHLGKEYVLHRDKKK